MKGVKGLRGGEMGEMYVDLLERKGDGMEGSGWVVGVEDGWVLWMKWGVGRVKKYFDGGVIGDNGGMVKGEK